MYDDVKLELKKTNKKLVGLRLIQKKADYRTRQRIHLMQEEQRLKELEKEQEKEVLAEMKAEVKEEFEPTETKKGK